MSATAHPLHVVQPSSEPPAVILPERASIFADRARRFDALAEGHALADWLRFLGRLTRAQHATLKNFPTVAVPHAALLERTRDHGMPPLPAQTLARDPAWRDALQTMLAVVEPVLPAAGRQVVADLQRASADTIESLADRVLRTELYGNNAAALPFIAAALQVYWTHLAITLGQQRIPALDVPGVCPCCGFLPVSSVVRMGGSIANLRYLHCALCNTEWNLVRAKCAACDAGDGISYRQLEGETVRDPGAVRAETCDSCHSYLKIVYQDKAAGADAVADDLASLALDVLVDEAGYTRAGPNLLLVPGEA